jgi:hypothetical protein
MLRPTVSRPVCFGVQHDLGPKIRFLLLSVPNFLMGDAISDEKTDLLFTIASYPRQPSHSTVPVPWLYSSVSDSRLPQPGIQVSVFISLKKRVSQLYPQALCSLFFASCESQSYSRCIRTPVHTGREDNTSLQTPSGSGKNTALYGEQYKTHKHTLLAEFEVLLC